MNHLFVHMMINLILIEISVVQPQLEGFFACLDIWTVFLDYLIGKVANARSDKLAEAEATVSRFVNQWQVHVIPEAAPAKSILFLTQSKLYLLKQFFSSSHTNS